MVCAQCGTFVIFPEILPSEQATLKKTVAGVPRGLDGSCFFLGGGGDEALDT